MRENAMERGEDRRGRGEGEEGSTRERRRGGEGRIEAAEGIERKSSEKGPMVRGGKREKRGKR